MAKRHNTGGTSVVFEGQVIRSAVAVGRGSVIVYDASRPEGSASILEEIAAIEHLLRSIRCDSAIKAGDSLQAAHAEAAKPEPDKSRVGSLMQTALEGAQNIDRFASIAERLLPHVTAVVGWIGKHSQPLLELVQRHIP